jgi:hypothetical protein
MVVALVVAGTSPKKFLSHSRFKVYQKTMSSSKLPGQRRPLVALVALAT